MYDSQAVDTLLTNAGFSDIHIEIVSKEGTGATASESAKGLILGTPAFKLISEKDPAAPARLVEIATKEIATHFGNEIITTTLNAVVCEAIKQ